MMRRLFAVALSLGTIGTTTTASAGAPLQTYRVVGASDSILDRLTQAGLLQSTDRWIDTEPGREIFNPGVQGRASYMDIWPEVIERSRPGGYVIFEDDGTRATDEEWTTFMHYLVDSTPDDRCLVGVLTYFDPDVHMGNHLVVKRHRNLMWSIFQEHRCAIFINWDQAAVTYPQYLADGQHPSPAGQIFIASRIDQAVGYRRLP